MTTIAIPPPTGPRSRTRGPAVGLGLSLLVHAALLAWLTRMPAPRPADEAPVARMRIWLAPPRPAPAAAAAPAAQAAQSAQSDTAAAPPPSTLPRQRRARPHAPARASQAPAILSAPSASVPDEFAVPPPAPSTPAAGSDASPDAGPVVDLAAARAAARRIAREDSKNLVALPKRKPVVDPNADHQVEDPLERARRSDCKTAYAGMGLLALIPLAKDALTGSGCKW